MFRDNRNSWRVMQLTYTDFIPSLRSVEQAIVLLLEFEFDLKQWEVEKILLSRLNEKKLYDRSLVVWNNSYSI